MEEKINSVKKEFTILEIEKLDGLTIGKNDEKITIYDASLKEQMVANYFNTKYLYSFLLNNINIIEK